MLQSNCALLSYRPASLHSWSCEPHYRLQIPLQYASDLSLLSIVQGLTWVNYLTIGLTTYRVIHFSHRVKYLLTLMYLTGSIVRGSCPTCLDYRSIAQPPERCAAGEHLDAINTDWYWLVLYHVIPMVMATGFISTVVRLLSRSIQKYRIYIHYCKVHNVL